MTTTVSNQPTARHGPERQAGIRTTVGIPVTFGALLLVLAVALTIHAALGPLWLDVVTYPISETVLNQLIGLEIVTVALVVPWLVVAAVGVIRSWTQAPVLALAPSAYVAYMYVQYVLGPEYGTYELVAFADLAVFVLGATLAGWAWSLSLQEWRSLAPLEAPARGYGWVLLGLAAFVVSRYVGGLVGSWGGESLPVEFADERTFYWSIVLLDLGVVVPLTLVAAGAHLAGRDGSAPAVYGVIGWFALVPPSVASMAIVMVVRDDPHGSMSQAVMLAAVSVVFLALAIAAYRPLVRGAP